jgi:hypothetical protein
VHNVLDACISITWGNGRGLGPGILEFFGPVKWDPPQVLGDPPIPELIRNKAENVSYIICDSGAVHL